MASVETLFDQEKDAWFDRQGDVCAWLRSKAFDMKYAYSRMRSRLLGGLQGLGKRGQFGCREAAALNVKLHNVLSETDPFCGRWRYIAEKRRWLV